MVDVVADEVIRGVGDEAVHVDAFGAGVDSDCAGGVGGGR